MNKYQEAWNKIKQTTNYDVRAFSDDDEEIKLLQELVDRATPMKPIKERNGYIICGNCGECTGIFTKYTEQTTDETFDGEIEFDYHIEYTENEFCSICGQALDWRKDE